MYKDAKRQKAYEARWREHKRAEGSRCGRKHKKRYRDRHPEKGFLTFEEQWFEKIKPEIEQQWYKDMMKGLNISPHI